MAKIPFDIKYRPQIESGEYKIIYLSYTTEEEYPARIICWDRHNEHPIVALVSNSGGYERVQMFQEYGIDNNNPHLGTLFIVTPEEKLSEFEKAVGLEIFDEPFGEEHIKVIKEESAKLLAIARNEIVKSGYAIIEGEHYLEEGRKNYERGKAEALKDLPRWKRAAASFGNYSVAPTETGALCLLIDGHYIMLSELMKLPGFKED